MPINRNGKHWCDPASATPEEDRTWVCPDDRRVWKLDEEGMSWSEVQDEPEESAEEDEK